MEIWQIPFIIITGFAAGLVNTLAGGGSVLTLPMMILFLGLSPALANGTNRIAVFSQCLSAFFSFQKRGYQQYNIGIYYSIPAIIGCLIGSFLAVSISNVLFSKLLALVMILVTAVMLLNPKVKINQQITPTRLKSCSIHLSFLLIGFFGGLFQVGMGIPITFVLVMLCGFDLVRTAYLKTVIIGIYITISLMIFAWYGEINWAIGLTLALGNALGGWMGSKIAVEKGEKIIRLVLALSSILMAAKLFF